MITLIAVSEAMDNRSNITTLGLMGTELECM